MKFLAARRQLENSTPAAQLEAAYQAIIDRMRREGVSFVEAVAPHLAWAPMPMTTEMLEEAYQRASKAIPGRFPTFADYAFAVKREYTNSIARYSLGDGYISTPYPGTYMNGFIADPTQWTLHFVLVAALSVPGIELPHALLSAAEVMMAFLDALLCFNGCYDATGVIMDEYNRIRVVRNRPLEVVQSRHFYLDASQVRDEKGRILETPPLYNKAFVGMDKKGNLIFGHRRMLGGSMKIPFPAFKIRWTSKDVIDRNPDLAKLNNSDRDIFVITPMASPLLLQNRAGFETFSDYQNDEAISVGKGRINVIFINNKIECIIDGDVLMPSVGYVISLNREKYLTFFQSNGLLNKNKDMPPADFTYDWEKESKRPWVYFGGASDLYSNGINKARDASTLAWQWTNEGWFRTLSYQTQGTSVHAWVEGPRTIFGQTESGKFFMFVFDGRSDKYRGVNFADAIKYIRLELQKRRETLKYAVNFDGGSSSGVVARGANGEVNTVNYPPKGSSSKEGDSRSVASYLVIEPKVKTGGVARRSPRKDVPRALRAGG